MITILVVEGVHYSFSRTLLTKKEEQLARQETYIHDKNMKTMMASLAEDSEEEEASDEEE